MSFIINSCLAYLCCRPQFKLLTFILNESPCCARIDFVSWSSGVLRKTQLPSSLVMWVSGAGLCIPQHAYSHTQWFFFSCVCLFFLKDTLRECRPEDRQCLTYLPWVSPIYFVTFVLMAQFVLVNVVVAVLMKHLEESNKVRIFRVTISIGLNTFLVNRNIWILV